MRASSDPPCGMIVFILHSERHVNEQASLSKNLHLLHPDDVISGTLTQGLNFQKLLALLHNAYGTMLYLKL